MKNKFGGFSLIELMMVVTISSLLVGVGVVSINTFLAKQELAKVRNEVMSAVKMARNYAVTSQSPSGFGSGLDYVAVTVTANGVLTVAPVSSVTGIGTSYFSKDVISDETTIQPLAFGDLLFSAGEGKLMEIQSGYVVRPVDAGETRAVSVTSGQTSDTSSVSIYASGVFMETLGVTVDEEPTATSIPPTTTPVPTATGTPLPTATPTTAPNCTLCGYYNTAQDACVLGCQAKGYSCQATQASVWCNSNPCFGASCY